MVENVQIKQDELEFLRAAAAERDTLARKCEALEAKLAEANRTLAGLDMTMQWRRLEARIDAAVEGQRLAEADAARYRVLIETIDEKLGTQFLQDFDAAIDAHLASAGVAE